MSGVMEQRRTAIQSMPDANDAERPADDERAAGLYASPEYIAEIQRKHPPVRDLETLLGPELDWDAADQDEWDQDRSRTAAANEEQRARRAAELGW